MPKSIFTSEYATFLRLLREARENSGVTQTELARRLKMTQSAVSKCERGERRLDMVEVWQWCRILKLSFEDFTAKLNGALSGSRSSRK